MELIGGKMTQQTWIKIILFPLSWAAAQLYGQGVRLRLWLYRRQFFTARHLPLNVISIGNLVVGGTGKTPHTALLAAYLQKKGLRVAVLSRGYRGKKMKTGAVISNDRTVTGSLEDGGEEPYWLAQKLPGIPVVVGRDRYQSGLLCHRTWRTEWAILDDGFQHLALTRQINILLWPANHRPGSGELLPLGRLREPLREIRRADLILITHAERLDPSERTVLKKDFQSGPAPVPVFFSVHKPAVLWRYPDHSFFPLERLEGKRVLAFCGLADPGSLFFSLNQLGADPVKLIEFPDHHVYREQDKRSLEVLGRSCGVEVLITTEKDALKLGDWNREDLQILVLGIAIEIEDPAFWDWLDRKTGMQHEA
jgi:tetraacyldisaccharide 4'-kinase